MSKTNVIKKIEIRENHSHILMVANHQLLQQMSSQNVYSIKLSMPEMCF